MSNEKREETDVNYLFDSIALGENQIWNEGFEEGLKKGKADGKFEGFHLGYHRGAEIGAELGFYQGIVDSLIKSQPDNLNDKCLSLIKKIQTLIEAFPRENNENEDIIHLRDNIRAKYKQLCSLLKIEALFPTQNQFSF